MQVVVQSLHDAVAALGKLVGHVASGGGTVEQLGQTGRKVL